MAHRWNIPFIRIFLILLLLWACQPVGPTNPFDPKSPETVQALAGIRGEVISVETGQPISEALVKVYELSEEASTVCGVSSDDMEADGSSDAASSNVSSSFPVKSCADHLHPIEYEARNEEVSPCYRSCSSGKNE